MTHTHFESGSPMDGRGHVKVLKKDNFPNHNPNLTTVVHSTETSHRARMAHFQL